MSSTIKPKELNKLLVKSGNKCAICKCQLVKLNTSNAANIGEAAHIYGEKYGSARYNASIPIEELNIEKNLIYLCCNCHTTIDKEENNYPVEMLYKIKAEHEKTVLGLVSEQCEKLNYPVIENMISRSVVPYKYKTDIFSNYYSENIKSNLFEACIKNKRIVLLGEARIGKSVVLKQLASEVSLDEEYGFYPVLIDLKNYISEDIEQLLDYYNNGVPVNRRFIILDGFDEIEETIQNVFSRNINKFIKKYPDAIIIISSRSNFYTVSDDNENGASFDGFKEYRFVPLTILEIKDFVTKSSIDFDFFESEIKKQKIESLIYNPFYLVEILNVIKKDGCLPDKSKLMERIISIRFKSDKNKYVNTIEIEKHHNRIILALQKVAFAMQCMHKTELSDYEYQELFECETRNLLDYSGIFKKSSNSTISFEHNNFREYLAARYISKLELKRIFEIICNKDGSIKDSWLNVLSFLVIFYNNSSLIDWLSKNDPEVLIKVNSNDIEENQKNQIFIDYMNNLTAKHLWISITRLNEFELAQFAESHLVCKYLIKEISEPHHYISQTNAINILSNFTSLYGLQNESYDALWSCITSDSYKSSVKIEAIETIAKLKLDRKETTECLLEQYYKGNLNDLKYGLINYLLLIDNSASFIKIFINEYNLSKQLNTDYSASIRWRLKEFFMQIDDYETVVQTLNSIDFEKDESIYDKEILNNVIGKAILYYLNGKEEIFEAMINMLIYSLKSYNNTLFTAVKSFFLSTNTVLHAFIQILPNLLCDNNYRLALLENFVNIDCHNKLIELYCEDKEKYREIAFNIFHFLSDNNPSLKKYEKAFIQNESNPPKRNKQIDYNAERKKGTIIYLNSLFDINDFSEQISRLLDYYKNPDLTYEELRENINRRDFKDYSEGQALCLVADCIRNSNFEDTKVINFTKNIVWENFSICSIYNVLKENSDYKLNDSQIDYIEKYCRKIISSTNWYSCKDGLTYPIIFTMFFNSLFDFKYSKSEYLNMLYIPKWYYEKDFDGNTNFSKYLMSQISNNELNEWLRVNAKPNIIHKDLFLDCINYCKDHNLGYAVELSEYVCNSDDSSYDKMCAMEYLLKIKGIDYVYDSFLKSDDIEIIKPIVRFSLDKKDNRLFERLKVLNKQSDDKNLFLSELIYLNWKYGLNLYVNFVKKT